MSVSGGWATGVGLLLPLLLLRRRPRNRTTLAATPQEIRSWQHLGGGGGRALAADAERAGGRRVPLDHLYAGRRG